MNNREMNTNRKEIKMQAKKFVVQSLVYASIFILFLMISANVNANPLNVLFKAQAPPGQMNNSNNCAATCALMVMSYYKGEIPTEQGIKDIDDWLKDNLNLPTNNYNGTRIDSTQLEKLVKEYGEFPNSYEAHDWNLNKIKEQIDLGRPVIASVKAKFLPNRGYPYKDWHSVVVIGYTDTHIISRSKSFLTI